MRQEQNERRREAQLLRIADHSHQAHPLDRYEQHKIILAVTQYFSEHYQEPIAIPGLGKQLGISLLHIETAFDVHKGKTANQALLEYRLNRLCDQMGKDPSQDINTQISQCGLGSNENHPLACFAQTNHHFIACFGIDLIEYHQQCFLAAAARLQRTPPDSDDDLHGIEPGDNRLLTRFHRPA